MKTNIIITFVLCAATAMFAQSANNNVVPQQQIAPIGQPAVMPQALPANALQQENAAPQPPPPDPEKFAALFPKIEDTTGKIGVPFWREYWYVILSAVIFAILLVALVFRPKRPQKISPKEKALKRLAYTMEKSKDMSEKIFALEISQAVRDYIEERRGIPAPERTTQEFLKIATTSDVFDETSQDLLKNILNLSDMAKFARQSFKGEERAELAKRSIEFIEYDDARDIEKTQKNDGDNEVSDKENSDIAQQEGTSK